MLYNGGFFTLIYEMIIFANKRLRIRDVVISIVNLIFPICLAFARCISGDKLFISLQINKKATGFYRVPFTLNYEIIVFADKRLCTKLLIATLANGRYKLDQ